MIGLKIIELIMSPFLQLIFALAVILVAAKFGGYLATRLGQPSVLGELLVGLVLGPTVLNMLQWPVFTDHSLEEMIKHLAEIGVLLLMFVAGLELHFNELVHNSKVSAYAGVLGVLLPVGLGYLVATAFAHPPQEALFIGLVLGATSVSISAQTLMELKVLRSRVGLGLLGAAVFDDVLVILLLSGFLALVSGEGGIATIGLLFVRMLIFLALSLLFGMKVLPYIVRRVAHLPVSQSVLTLALVVTFVFGLAAELIGSMAAITGTFLAGLMFARSPEKERLERGVSALAYAFFVPIFFVKYRSGGECPGDHRSCILAIRDDHRGSHTGKVDRRRSGRPAGPLFLARIAAARRRDDLRGEVGLIIAAVGVEEGMLEWE